jgi:hypothetical protein
MNKPSDLPSAVASTSTPSTMTVTKDTFMLHQTSDEVTMKGRGSGQDNRRSNS